MDVLIDRRELLEKARERNLPLTIVEKDYVLGWLLFGFSSMPQLVFKGGTALSKIYFPKIWRLSEDLDFTFLSNNWKNITKNLKEIFETIKKKSGIELNLKNHYSNPEYLQLKIQYHAVIGKNWVKVDIMKNDLVEKPVKKEMQITYSDYFPFKIEVESLEEIFAGKLRTVIERKKSRDYFDLWKLSQIKINKRKLKRIFKKKCEIKNVKFFGLKQIFPKDIYETLKPYWDKELRRLVSSYPDLEIVISDLKKALKFLI